MQLKVYSSHTTTRQNQAQQKRLPSCTLRPSRGDGGLMFSKQAMKPIMHVVVALFLLCYGVGNIRCSTVPENSTDMLSLLDFRQAITSDPKGVFNFWKTSTPFCQWTGVACSTTTHRGRVTKLDLSDQGLSGPISPSLGNLTFLRTLNLSKNQFAGQLPPLNYLHRLQVLDLSTNSLHGTIPHGITNCSNLRTLVLYENQLKGEIPDKLHLLSNLSDLRLSWNNLTGTIPPTLGNLTRLEVVGLAYNYDLTGSIPDELGKLSNLSGLFIGGNSLSGGFPHALLNLSSLQKLSLDDTMLGKSLPPNIGDALPKLQLLLMSNSMFEGHIPASLGNASNLKFLDLQSNNFSGHIPVSFGKLSSLVKLILENNRLEAADDQSWHFLSALINCTSLNVLSLRGNQLQGPLPSVIGNLSMGLEMLFLGENNLSAVVPPSIGNLHGLFHLDLGTNSFNGTIEEWVGKLTNLEVLELQENQFSGSILSPISSLTRLGRLYVRKNDLEGFIPPDLGNLQQLEYLDLSQNNLKGNIPTELGNLAKLIGLDFSSNKLTGEIPDALDHCQNLETIIMDKNFLTGDMPVSFGEMKTLSMLTLSHNNLSGTIPITLGDLPLLTRLDLSYNDFHGEVPTNGVFENPTAVSLDGNPGLCGGAVYLHMRSCPEMSRRVERGYYLIRVLIPILAFMSLILAVYFLLLLKKTSRTFLSLPYIGENFPKVSYKDLAQATRNFSESNLIGRGSCGSVYRGELMESKMEVAVKVFDLEMRGAERSFMSECKALRSIQHRNLLPIITACSTLDNRGNDFKALLYEFIPNGSLVRWLHHEGDTESPKHLDLTQRINIAVNIADVLDYLHNDCGRPLVHCDLKPNNILLNDDMTALLGDFGIARFYVDSRSASTGSLSSIGVKGTIGYIPPEYAGGGHASISGDVYSFGIVLLEIMTGKRPTDPMFMDGLDIVNFVQGNFPHQIFHSLDAHLIEESKSFTQAKTVSENPAYQCMVSLLQVALSCAHSSPSERMQMRQVASKLHAIKTLYISWYERQDTSAEYVTSARPATQHILM